MDSAADQIQSPLVSFILPHHGRNELLLETIRSVAAQDVDVDKTEIIIVSKAPDAERGRLRMELDHLEAGGSIKLLSIGDHENISRARNLGASAAGGEYLAFIDSDVRLSVNWLSTMIGKLASPEYILISAVQIPDTSRTSNDIIRSGMSESHLGDANESLPGANLFLSRADFNRSDKFPEHLQTCEDSVFTNSLLAKGKLLLTDESGFVHLGEDLTLAALFHKEIWRGKSNLAAMQGRAVTLAELPSLVLPVVVLLGLFLLPVAVVTGFYGLALAIGTTVLAIPLLYSIRLKMRSSIELGYQHVILFFLVYFAARGYGMFRVFFEVNKSKNLESHCQ